MIECGTIINDLGCFPHCDEVELNIPIDPGTYVFRFNYLNSIIYQNVVVTDLPIIDTSKLPFNQEFLITIMETDGTIVDFGEDPNVYSNFKLKIFYKNEI